MPDGAGAVMIDGKMQDDATWKQAKVLLDLAKLVAARRLRDGETLRLLIAVPRSLLNPTGLND